MKDKVVRQNRHLVPANQCLRDAQMNKYKMARQFVPNGFVHGVYDYEIAFWGFGS